MVRQLQAVSPVSLVDQLTAEIRLSIVNGTLLPGRPFGIAFLAEQLSVSHIPVREALRRLETEGLVILQPGRGAIVTPLRVVDIQGIYRMRLWIEPPLARLSCTLLSEDDLERLENLLDIYKEPHGDIDKEIAQHREFHFGMLRPAASAWDLRVLENLWNANERYARILFGPNDAESQRYMEKSHRKLFDAVATGSPERIETELTSHLAHNEAELIQAFEVMDEDVAEA
jgi:DNA-binding GntR family transcriptional regulator